MRLQGEESRQPKKTQKKKTLIIKTTHAFSTIVKIENPLFYPKKAVPNVFIFRVIITVNVTLLNASFLPTHFKKKKR